MITEFLLSQLEKNGKYAIVVVQEEEEMKVYRFTPGKDLIPLEEIQEGEALVLDGADVQSLLNPKGPHLLGTTLVMPLENEEEK